MTDAMLVHATAVAIDGKAILLRGPPGAGKSDLALRLIDGGADLIADDQAELRRAGKDVRVRAPAAIAGLIEIRGVGILRLPALEEAPLAMCVDLLPPAEIERLPQPRLEEVLGVEVPLIAVPAFEASAAAKLRIALSAFSADTLPAILKS
jgi:serine kinase of HPr protein (carbohydrate metabolism regulator)